MTPQWNNADEFVNYVDAAKRHLNNGTVDEFIEHGDFVEGDFEIIADDTPADVADKLNERLNSITERAEQLLYIAKNQQIIGDEKMASEMLTGFDKGSDDDFIDARQLHDGVVERYGLRDISIHKPVSEMFNPVIDETAGGDCQDWIDELFDLLDDGFSESARLLSVKQLQQHEDEEGEYNEL